MTEIDRRVQCGGVSLAVHGHVDDKPAQLLLLHGLGSDVRGAWELTGWLRMLGRAQLGWIAPDLRGHGTSDKPHDPASYTLTTLVADVVRVLDDAVVASVAVVGYSLGARIAVELAALHPGRVSRLVLGGLGDGQQPPSLIEGLLERLPSSADRDAVRACAEGVGSDRSRLPLRELDVPVLLVAGENDSVAGSIEAIATQLRCAGSQRVAGRNHFTTLSAPMFKQLAQDFLLEDAR